MTDPVGAQIMKAQKSCDQVRILLPNTCYVADTETWLLLMYSESRLMQAQ